MRTKCPTCGRVLEGTPEALTHRPFCSERCRSVDLGKWLDAAYRISAPVSEEDLDESPRPSAESSAESDSEDTVN